MVREPDAGSTGHPALPFDFDEVPVATGTRSCNALVMTPHQPMVFDRERLERVTRSTGLNAVDRSILARVRKRSANTPIMMMRGIDDSGEALWRFDPDFSDAELEQAGRIFVGSLLPLYRRLLAAGIVLFVHAHWGERETPPLRRGIAQLVSELKASPEHLAVHDLDHWILKNMLLFSSLSMLHVAQNLLPDHLSLLERREHRIRALLARVPAQALEDQSTAGSPG